MTSHRSSEHIPLRGCSPIEDSVCHFRTPALQELTVQHVEVLQTPEHISCSHHGSDC